MEKTKVLAPTARRTCPYCQTTVGPRRRRAKKASLPKTPDAVLAGFIAAMDPFQALEGAS